MRRIDVKQNEEAERNGNGSVDSGVDGGEFTWPHLDYLCPVLAKSCDDWYAYRIGLRDGSSLMYEHATLSQNREWLSLTGVHSVEGPLARFPDDVFARGIDVAIFSIAWAVDMPS